MIKQQQASPSSKLLAATFLALLLVILVIWISSERPWYGMTLAATTDGGVQLVALDNTVTQTELSLPLQVLALGQANNRLWLSATDIIEEPDVFNSYTQLNEFRQRQQILSDLMQVGSLFVLLQDSQGQQYEILLNAQTHRPLGHFPFSFYVQLITGIGGFLIGSWVLALRPHDAAARCFMLTGAGLMMAAFAAAIYSTRELALPATSMRWLMALNHSGSIGFGFALMSLFLFFPQRLVAARWVALAFVSYLLWLLLEQAEASTSPQAMMYLSVLVLSGCILLLIALQWWHSRGQPQALAALRWLGLVTLVTICCFLLLAAIPALFNVIPVISQGSAFGFFLILYAGLALGLKRYRLFDLDRWAFYVLLWVLAGTALVGLDLLLLTLLHWQQKTSLLVSLLLCGFLYLPLRGWLWHRLVERPRPDSRSLFNHVIEIALAPSKDSYIQRWQALLNHIFDPLHMENNNAQTTQIELSLDRQSLHIPAVLHAPAMSLVLAEKGKRLFTPADVKLMVEIVDMLNYANENRQAHQQGVHQERKRIAQDLHDDLGSRLLTGLHQPQLNDVRDTISIALAEMRSIIRGLAEESLPLEQLLAELREESYVRCEGAGIALQWPLLALEQSPLLDYRTYRHLLSAIRELFSNIIRHADANEVQVQIFMQAQQLQCKLYDNGTSFDGQGEGGQGLLNLQNRIEQLGGTLLFEPQAKGTITHLIIPLAKAEYMER